MFQKSFEFEELPTLKKENFPPRLRAVAPYEQGTLFPTTSQGHLASSEEQSNFIAPKTGGEFARMFGITVLNLNEYYKPEHLEFAAKFLFDFENHPSKRELLQAPTGKGKTVRALLIASYFISRGIKVLFLAPTVNLVDQTVKKQAKRFLNLGDEGVATLDGNISHAKRVRSLSNPKTLLLVATPQTIESGIYSNTPWFKFSLIGIVLFDEAHHRRGKEPYTRLSQAVKHAGLPGLYFSAFPGKDDHHVLVLEHELGTGKCLTSADTERPRRESVMYFDLPPRTSLAATRLMKLGLEFSAELTDIIQANRSLFSQLALPHDGKPLPKKLPSSSRLKRIFDYIFSEGQELSPRLKLAYSLWCGLRDISYIHTVLTLVGDECFRRACAERIIHFRSPGAPKYLRRICERAEFREAFRSIAADTPYENLLRGYTLEESFDLSFPKAPWRKSPTASSEFLDEARRAAIILPEYDNPKEQGMIEFLHRRLNREELKGVIIFVYLTDQATFMASRLEHFLGGIRFPVVPVMGQAAMRSVERFCNIELFDQGAASGVVSTSVLEEGTDIAQANTALMYNHTSEGIRFGQRRGRVGRTGECSEILYLANKDTSDIWIYQAGILNYQKRVPDYQAPIVVRE